MGIIDYNATGGNRLKMWELMIKATDEKLVYKQNETNFWTFHEIFSTHVANMSWTDAMIFNVDGDDKDLTTQFGEIDMETLQNSWTILKALPSTDAAAEIRKLKNSAMYTWLLNSMDKDFKKYLTQNAGKHERQGPLAWKMITEHSVKSDKQAIRRAMCKMHTLSLDQFDYDINKFIDTVVDNKAILESCGETDNSIASNLFRILGAAPCEELKTWMLGHQNTYDDGGEFDLDNFMTSCKNKYSNYMADGLWKSTRKTKKDLEKDSEIVALTSKIDRLEQLLFAKKNDYPSGQDSQPSWKTVAPKSGESWPKEKNGKTWNWCKYHKYWTTGHKTDNCRKGEAERSGTVPTNQTGGGTNPSLTLNLASLDDEEIFLAESHLDTFDSFDHVLDAAVAPTIDTSTTYEDSNSTADKDHLNLIGDLKLP